MKSSNKYNSDCEKQLTSVFAILSISIVCGGVEALAVPISVLFPISIKIYPNVHRVTENLDDYGDVALSNSRAK